VLSLQSTSRKTKLGFPAVATNLLLTDKKKIGRKLASVELRLVKVEVHSAHTGGVLIYEYDTIPEGIP
jgi:hypothetical protein